jgi:hypothetical protein
MERLCGETTAARDLLARMDSVEYRELVLVPGQTVEIVGTLTRQADPQGAAIGRETPTRWALTSGKQPLLVVPENTNAEA